MKIFQNNSALLNKSFYTLSIFMYNSKILCEMISTHQHFIISNKLFLLVLDNILQNLLHYHNLKIKVIVNVITKMKIMHKKYMWQNDMFIKRNIAV